MQTEVASTGPFSQILTLFFLGGGRQQKGRLSVVHINLRVCSELIREYDMSTSLENQ